jgi:hypothetical protein
MKALKFMTAFVVLFTSSVVLAEDGADRVHSKMMQANEQAMRAYAAANGKTPPEVVHYRYGMKLDVAKVISVASNRDTCDVAPAQMTYEDSSGKLNTLEYRSSGIGCRGQN